MKVLLSVLLVLALLAGGTAVWLAATTPRTAVPLQFPLDPSRLELLGRVPADADACALVPAPAALERTLLANPVTAPAVAEWLARQPAPGPWILGAADAVIWRKDEETSFAIRFDPFRALIARAWTGVAVNAEARWEGRMLVIEREPTVGVRPDAAALDLAAALPESDVFVIQRNAEKGDFPPIARPAVTGVRVTAEEIVLVSRARSESPGPGPAVRARFPAGPMLSASFAAEPRLVRDLGRLTGTDLSSLTADGGFLALYGVDEGTLLPRPRGLVALSTTPAAAELVESARSAIELVGEVREQDGRILVSFDRKSMGLWLGDRFSDARWPANLWSVRLDPARLVPVLRRLGDSRAVRFAAPRVHRAARDLRRWIGAFERAGSVEAAGSAVDGIEELRVRVASK